MSKYIPIAQIRRDGGTQSRMAMDESTIADYVEVVKQGTQFPAVTLYFDGENYWLADGFHRVEAHIRAEVDKVWADVHQGTRRDAVLASVGANASHGLRRTNDDKRRAAMVLLQDDEWKQWSDREIARKVGVSPQTISNYRKELPSDQNGQITERTVIRNGQTYTMKTENIGSTDKAPTLAELHNQDRKKFQAGSADNYLLIYRHKEANTDCYLFIGSDSTRVYARSEGKIKADTITVEDEKLPIAKVNANHYREMMFLDINLRYINFDESQLCETLTPLLHEISIQNLIHYKVPEKKPAPTLDKPQDPPKFEDVTQHEGLKLYYLKPQVMIDIEHGGMWRNAYHMLKKRYAQDAILLCLINSHGFVAMYEDATALESALATIKHEGKRVGDYYLMPHSQDPFYSEVLRLTGKKIVYFVWINNDAVVFWRDNWNSSKQLSLIDTNSPAADESPVAVADETPAYQVEDRVIVKTISGFKPGTIRYIKNGKYGVFLDQSGSTHYYEYADLSPEPTGQSEFAAIDDETPEVVDEPTITIKEGDLVLTRTGRKRRVESIQGVYAYIDGNPHKLTSLTLMESELSSEMVLFFSMLETRRSELLQVMKDYPQYQKLWQMMNDHIQSESAGEYA